MVGRARKHEDAQRLGMRPAAVQPRIDLDRWRRIHSRDLRIDIPGT